jgi:hypothetical protein
MSEKMDHSAEIKQAIADGMSTGDIFKTYGGEMNFMDFMVVLTNLKFGPEQTVEKKHIIVQKRPS